MAFYAGNIVTWQIYKLLIATAICATLLIASSVWIGKERKCVESSKTKDEFLQFIYGFRLFIIILGIMFMPPFTYLSRAEFMHTIGGGNNQTLVEQVIYVDSLNYGNGSRPVDENGNKYFHVYDEDLGFNGFISECLGEYCVIEYYKFSKVLQRVTVIEDIEILGHELIKDEIGQLNLPQYPGNDEDISPGNGWEWYERADYKNFLYQYWINIDTGECLNPDINNDQLNGPHWDYIRGDERYRLFPDGRVYIIDILN